MWALTEKAVLQLASVSVFVFTYKLCKTSSDAERKYVNFESANFTSIGGGKSGV